MANQAPENDHERFNRILDTVEPVISTTPILDPARALVEVLQERGIGADFVDAERGRYTLVVWPAHRPALRSVMVSFGVVGDRVIAYRESTPVELRTPDDMREFLDG